MKDVWPYLASVIDLYSRKILGYAYGVSMTAEIAVNTKKCAICGIIKKEQS